MRKPPLSRRKPRQRSRSNSDAVRNGERLAAEAGVKALCKLRRLGGLQDVFGRAAAKSR